MFEGHPSWRAILDFYIKGIILTGILTALVVLIGNLFGDGASGGLIALILIVGATVTVIAGFIKRVATRYTITSKRLNIKHGIVSREVQETRLTRVQDVTYNQSVLQRMLGIGDVDFDTAANDPTDFVFAGVADPAGVVQDVYQATEISEGPDGGQGESAAGLGETR